MKMQRTKYNVRQPKLRYAHYEFTVEVRKLYFYTLSSKELGRGFGWAKRSL